MKTMFLRREALTCFFFLGLTMSIFAQGQLTPLGTPAPTMKTLDQVKPGIPIDPSKAGFTTPYTISAPGNYYLTGNIAVSTGNAIVITTNNVTLNLSGFTISSTASPIGGNGVLVNDNLTNITILNGFVTGNVTNTNTGSGFSYGINASGSAPQNSAKAVRVTGISVSGCGNGIAVGQGGSLVESCQVYTAGSVGISADTIKASSAKNCGGNGISGTEVADSVGSTIGTGNSSGISATTAHNCTGSCSNAGIGIQANYAANCLGTSSSGVGLEVVIAASNCGGTSNGSTGFGIHSSSPCTLTNCFGAGTGNGIRGGVGSTLTNCTASGCGGIGIVLVDKSLAQNCNASGNVGDGITVTMECSVLNCVACANGADGIHLVTGGTTNNRIDGNNASNNVGIGIHQTGGPDIIIRNLARSNVSGTNYSPSSGSSVGPVGAPNTATSPWANF